MKSLQSLLFLFFLVLRVYAQERFCSDHGECISISIPATNSPNPDLYLTLQAPSSDKWFGFGFGSQMAGSLMIVSWPNGNQVVVSTRLAVTENLPPVYTGPTITQIAHNVSSTETIVQLKCSGCTKWTTGNLNVQSTSANLIYAWCSQPPFTPSDPNSGFDQHDDHGNFNLNLKAAQTTTATAPPPLTNTPTSSGGLSYRQKIILIHGLIMGFVWVVLFPTGAIIIRFLGNHISNAVMKHRIVQVSTLLLLVIAAGIGIYLAWGHQFTLFHHWFGIFIVAAVIVQLFFGAYHHHRFVKDKPTHRRWFTYVHLWLGRIVICCGLANCGFGLLAASEPIKWAVTWWIVSGILVGLYFGAFLISRFVQRKRNLRHTGETYGVAPSPYAPGAPYARANEEAAFELKNPYQAGPRYGGGGGVLPWQTQQGETPYSERYRDQRERVAYDPPVGPPTGSSYERPPEGYRSPPSRGRTNLHDTRI